MESTGFSFDHALLLLLIVLISVAAAAYYFTRSRRRTQAVDSSLYIEALQAMVAGDDSTAFSKLKGVVSTETENLEAYINLGDILRKHKRVDRAIRLHKELTLREGLTVRQKKAIHRALALDHLTAEHTDAARQSLAEILKIDKNDLWAAERLVRLYEDGGRWDEAFQMRTQIDKRLGQDHQDVLALYKVYAGQALAGQNEQHKARLSYKEALGLDEKCLPAYLGIGDAYFADRRLEDAVEWWSKLIEIQPRAGYLVFDRLKKAYFELGQYGEITRVFERTLEEDAKNLAALSGLAEIARKKADLREAESHYRRMLDIDADNVVARAGLIAILKDQGETDAACAEIDRLLQTLPFRPRGYRCRKCSHKSLEPIWRCPKCKSFNSFPLWDEEKQTP